MGSAYIQAQVNQFGHNMNFNQSSDKNYFGSNIMVNQYFSCHGQNSLAFTSITSSHVLPTNIIFQLWSQVLKKPTKTTKNWLENQLFSLFHRFFSSPTPLLPHFLVSTSLVFAAHYIQSFSNPLERQWQCKRSRSAYSSFFFAAFCFLTFLSTAPHFSIIFCVPVRIIHGLLSPSGCL